MNTEFQYDVFLSYNQADKPRVRKLAKRLKQAGLRVWFDEWAIKAGDDIYLALERGLEAARVQVLCLSPAALGSEWVALERSTVLFRDPTNQGRRFVPLLLADCTLPDTLRRYKYVDFRQATPAAFDELLAACRVEAEAAPPVPKLEPKKKPAKTEPKLVKPPEPAEPMAVLERKLTGHVGRIEAIAVSPDSKWAVTGAGSMRLKDFVVRVWNLETGECRARLKGHRANVNCVCFTPDGKRVLSASSDKSILVWNTKSWRRTAKCRGHSSAITSIVALPDNRRAVSGSWDGTLRLWEIDSGRELKVLASLGEPIRSVDVNKDGDMAICGGLAGRLSVFDIQTGRWTTRLRGHTDSVDSVRFTPDGSQILSAGSDRTIRIWDSASGNQIGIMEGHEDGIWCLSIASEGAFAAAADSESIRIWDWEAGTLQEEIAERDRFCPYSVVISPDCLRLLAGNVDGTIYVYRLTGVRSAPPAEPTRRYVNAKVVLLGEGEVGKTSLAHRLIEDKYVEKDRTHGMDVWTLNLPPALPGSSGRESAHSPSSDRDQSRLTSAATEDREALLWDLAGQEDYRLIHRLFLDETALALLLINPQKDDPFAEAGDWLKALDTASLNDVAKRQAARLLIFSQTDVGGMKVSNAKIERFIREHRFANWLATSAKNGENCSDEANAGKPSPLKQLIADSVPWDKLPWTATPRLLAELKNAVMKMRDTTDIRLLRFAELAQRLEQTLPGERFGESDVRTAVSLLANHGLARPLKFGDLVLLQPELLNGYAGAIIRSARAHKDEIGCVREADIYDPKFDFTGVERLKHRPDEELLLRAMVQTFLDHSLCIAEDTPHGRHLVFPSQYRREKDLPRDPDIFVSYTFSGEWQTVWTTLVVRLWYSQEFEHRELWRNAAEFASPKDYTLGLKLTHKQGEGEATISLYFDKEVEDVLKAIFIEYVHRHLAKFACEVTRDRRYVCPECGKPVKDLEAVRKRLEAKKDFITCQECDERVPLQDFIEQRLKSDPIARKILAMDEIATRELDTQALEQILIGHMMAIAGEANQIFRPTTMFDFGVDGEVEFKDDNGYPSGKRIYIQLKSGNSYLRTRKGDGSEVFDVKNEHHLETWVNQPVDVYLVIRQTDEVSGGGSIRWMNVTRYLKTRKDKQSRQIIFDGVKLDMEAVWKVRDEFFPPKRAKAGKG